MPYTTHASSTVVIIDPLDHFLNTKETASAYKVTVDRILQELGILLNWVTTRHKDETMRQALKRNYSAVSGMYPMTGGEINEEGIYKYPEDPDLVPLIKCIDGEETVYMYSYGIVAVVHEGKETFVTRMD